jgi:hypothetical protein
MPDESIENLKKILTQAHEALAELRLERSAYRDLLIEIRLWLIECRYSTEFIDKIETVLTTPYIKTGDDDGSHNQS